jgi:hypothetical protein
VGFRSKASAGVTQRVAEIHASHALHPSKSRQAIRTLPIPPSNSPADTNAEVAKSSVRNKRATQAVLPGRSGADSYKPEAPPRRQESGVGHAWAMHGSARPRRRSMGSFGQWDREGRSPARPPEHASHWPLPRGAWFTSESCRSIRAFRDRPRCTLYTQEPRPHQEFVDGDRHLDRPCLIRLIVHRINFLR